MRHRQPTYTEEKNRESERQRYKSRVSRSVEDTQEVEKIDLGLGLGLVEYLRNRSPVPEMTRATQRRHTD